MVRTDDYKISDGDDHNVRDTKGADMADPRNLAQLVKMTLDDAEASGAKQMWLRLVIHGSGDGGGLEADSFKDIMPMP